MARTLSSIYDDMCTYKDAEPLLQGFAPQGDTLGDLAADINTGSKVARWRIHFWVVAVAIWTLENLFELNLNATRAAVATAEFGTIGWMYEKITAFQYGDPLIMVNNKPGYAVIDATKQIIKRRAIVEQPDGTLMFKVAKLVGNVVTPLDPAEETAFRSYMRENRYPGMRYDVLSQTPDLLRSSMEIHYDALIPWATIETAVRAAIDNYLANKLSFNGQYLLEKMVDDIQAIEGVKSVLILTCSAQAAGLLPTTITREYNTVAGYMVADNIVLIPYATI